MHNSNLLFKTVKWIIILDLRKEYFIALNKVSASFNNLPKKAETVSDLLTEKLIDSTHFTTSHRIICPIIPLSTKKFFPINSFEKLHNLAYVIFLPFLRLNNQNLLLVSFKIIAEQSRD